MIPQPWLDSFRPMTDGATTPQAPLRSRFRKSCGKRSTGACCGFRSTARPKPGRQRVAALRRPTSRRTGPLVRLYRQKQRRHKPKLEAFLPIIHEILKQDEKAPKKQRHTITRIFDRLRSEYGYTGAQTVVGDAVREWRAATAEVFMPLSHPAGEAQADFGEATVVLKAKRRRPRLRQGQHRFSSDCDGAKS